VLSVVADGSTEPVVGFGDDTEGSCGDGAEDDDGVPAVADGSTEPVVGFGDDTEGCCREWAEADDGVPVSAEATPTPELTAMATPTLTVRAPVTANPSGTSLSSAKR
jgi:hypothetical protein